MDEVGPVKPAGDPVRVTSYDPTWPELFHVQAAALRAALGLVALRIDHIGSTAIPALSAKPVIDIQISVSDFDPVDRFRLPLEACGYVFRPANPDRTKRYFREPPGQRRTHLHVRRAGSFSEQFALLFRNFLRAHSEVAWQYGELKVQLAHRYAHVADHNIYTEAKGPFIWQVMRQASAWAQDIGWQAGPSDA